jgi:polar amino acid transport system substrate-binding protein
MKKGILYSLIVFTLFLVPFPTYAQEKITEITIVSDKWENCTNPDGTGMYWDIFRAVFDPSGIKVKPTMRSYTASMEMARQKKTDAAVGAYIDEVKGVLYPKNHFGVDAVAVAYRRDKVVDWKGEQSLSNKNIAWIKGYSFDEYLTVPVKKMELEDRTGVARMLDNNRIDYFMDAYADIMDMVEKKTLDPAKYDVKIVKKLNLYLVFANDEKGKQLRGIFDENIQKIVASGEMGKICKKWAHKNLTCPF